jgi:4-hydroxy-4-methyl-2-oxoglutarate aldolase
MNAALRELPTAPLTDACLRLDVALRFAPSGIRAVSPGTRIAGPAVPVRHYGSVDVFLEAMNDARPGDVLVIDNGGRIDEACIGDLVALEAKACGLAGIVVWGLHRDAAELERIGVPVFSYGVCPSGPRRLDPRGPDALLSARFGDFLVTREDVVVADADGVLFLPASSGDTVAEAAAAIAKREREQAEAVHRGRTLRDQLRFAEYLKRRTADPAYTFRKHLRRLGGAIEE